MEIKGIIKVSIDFASIKGLMIESNLISGNQKIPSNLNDLAYGQSITDGCVDWSKTEEMILLLKNAVMKRKKME